jgi:hypothetical protein
MRGARWAQDEFLPQHPDPDLKVYVVWVITTGTDPAIALPDVLTDRRVQHLRDPEKIAGTWFAEMNGNRGMTYDLYYVFGPDARWDAAPAPMVLGGATVITDTAEIVAAVEPLLGE